MQHRIFGSFSGFAFGISSPSGEDQSIDPAECIEGVLKRWRYQASESHGKRQKQEGGMEEQQPGSRHGVQYGKSDSEKSRKGSHHCPCKWKDSQMYRHGEKSQLQNVVSGIFGEKQREGWKQHHYARVFPDAEY